ncbi:hypothetical protein ACHAXN_007026 [Cyclotella atomus]
MESRFGSIAFSFPRSIAKSSSSRSIVSILRQQADGIVSDVKGKYNSTQVDTTSQISSSKPIHQVDTNSVDIFNNIVNARYACTRFQRYQEPPINGDNTTTTTAATASLSNPKVIEAALQCLSLSQRAPTGFNAQPYRVVLVHESNRKMELSQYCIGRNADRIRDSDCTAIFLSDKEVGRDWRRFQDFLVDNMEDGSANAENRAKTRARRPLSKAALNKMRVLILLFSSGYPFPRILARPFSFCLRVAMSIFALLGRILKSILKIFPSNLILPTLSSSETWSQKNCMLVAMTYMLACTSRGLSTCPMEGFDAQGIRNTLGIPRRFGIPLIVSTGTRYWGDDENVDDVGVRHGDGSLSSPRYPMEEVVFGNEFGCRILCPS